MENLLFINSIYSFLYKYENNFLSAANVVNVVPYVVIMRRALLTVGSNVRPLLCSFLIVLLHKLLESAYSYFSDYYSAVIFTDIHKNYVEETALGWPLENDFSGFLSKYIPSQPIIASFNSNPEDYAIGRISEDVSQEALQTIRIASQLAEKGKGERASKLFEHAVSLDSHQPEVLNEYGVFLERNKNDIIRAEHMYCKALQYNSSHEAAIANRRRASPIVAKLDKAMFQRIKRKKEVLLKALNKKDNIVVLQKAHHELFLQHIHHTAALEGNTFSIDQARVLMETGRAIGGKSVAEHNELLGLAEALLYINSTLLKKIGNFNVQDLLDLHQHIMGHVDPRTAGQIRNKQVFVSKHIPPKTKLVPALLEDLVQWINNNLRSGMPDIKLSALIHYKLVYIHPFLDGNGRTARLLMNSILLGSGYPIVNIGLNDKHEYYTLLQAANDGDARPFIRFIGRCTERTLNDLLWLISDEVKRPLARSLIDSREERSIQERKDDKDKIRELLLEPDDDKRFQNFREGKEHYTDLELLGKTLGTTPKYEETINLSEVKDDRVRG
ncbi:unnamed protein product [Dimorphilus gyrociliatus]|uniref:protein adenylyltransferase n=1 Tax=Dimorphilus gyrociliatus TaxID=2664684 RepID=A0A7I8VGB2_9ANNE|nr:unnamed protein product [Dimorphilus gyrociliatus]